MAKGSWKPSAVCAKLRNDPLVGCRLIFIPEMNA
jgi:hypothetical protein